MFLEIGNLTVRRVAALVAKQQGIFPDRGQIHKFVGHIPPHHSHIRFHSDHRQLTAVEDVKIGLVMGPVLPVKTLPVLSRL